MIGGFRKFAKSKWSALLFGLLILSFGIFGFQDPFRGITGGGFIKIGDREIHSRDVTKELSSDRYEGRGPGTKAEDLTIKKLTRGNPTMAAKFAELKQAQISDGE